MVKKFMVVLFLLELAYLTVVNGLLALPLTQAVLNEVRPEKFQLSWSRAWSYYPFRVHVTGLSVNGESRSQQWQLEAETASASMPETS